MILKSQVGPIQVFGNANYDDIKTVQVGDPIDLSIFEGEFQYDYDEPGDIIRLNNDDFEIFNIWKLNPWEEIYFYGEGEAPTVYEEEGRFSICISIKDFPYGGPAFVVLVEDNIREKISVPQYDAYNYTGELIELSLPELGTAYEVIEGTYEASNVGTYTFTLSLTDPDSYVWLTDDGETSTDDQIITWSIEKVMPTIKITDRVQTPSYIKAPKVTVTPGLTNGRLEISYAEEGSDEFSSSLPYSEGKYRVKALIKGDKNLYNTYVIKDFEIADYTKGDLDDNDEIDVIDVRLLLQNCINALDYSQLPAMQLAIMDINNDDVIDIIDVRLLLQSVIN